MGCGSSTVQGNIDLPRAENSEGHPVTEESNGNIAGISSFSDGPRRETITFGAMPKKDDVNTSMDFKRQTNKANHRMLSPAKTLLKTAVMGTIAIRRFHPDHNMTSMNMNNHYFGENPNHKTLLSSMDVDKSMSSFEAMNLLSMAKDEEGAANETTLFAAARAGRLKTVKGILQTAVMKGISIPEKDLTAAFFASVAHNHIEIVEFFVEIAEQLGFKVAEVVDEFKCSPAKLAASQGHARMLKVLQSAGADMERTMENGETPLMAAVKGGHIECVKQLLDAGASPTDRMNDDTGPMILVARGGHLEIAKLLVARGADPRELGKANMTPLFAALDNKHENLVEFLLDSGEGTDGQNSEGSSPLMVAASHGLVTATKALLSRNADVDFGDTDGDSPLWAAAKEGHIKVAKILIGAGADVDQERNHGEAPLWMAAYNNHLDIVKVLCDAGADVDCIDRRDITPLLHAAAAGKTDLAQLLLNYGADVCAADAWGNGALVHAVARGSLELVQMLLMCNACLDEVNEDGQDVLTIAAEQGHRSVAEFLANAMGVPMPRIEKSISLLRHCKSDRIAEEELDARGVSDLLSKKENESYDMEKHQRKEAQKGRRRDRTSMDVSNNSIDLSRLTSQGGGPLPGLPEDDREGTNSSTLSRPSIDTSLPSFASAGPGSLLRASTAGSSFSTAPPVMDSPVPWDNAAADRGTKHRLSIGGS